MEPVFDGHNDVLSRLWQTAKAGGDPIAEFVEGRAKGHIDGPRAKAGGLAGGVSAIYVSSADHGKWDFDDRGHYAVPLAAPLDPAAALAVTLEQAAIAIRLDRAGAWRLCRSVADIRAAFAEGVFAAVLHLEGCEAIDADLNALDVLHAAGLRSLGPVWSRNNIFGHGVPFAFPASPDSGPGLTEAGFRLVKACNRLGIAIDLAHITEQGFWDVARVSDQPLIASHSNAHALTPVARNLTDRQLDAIRDSGGIAGLNYAVTMLREDGAANADTPLSDLLRHIDYVVERIGVEHVALGSDFDGALIPEVIGDAAGTQKLVAALKEHGYAPQDVEKLVRENWLRVLGRGWHESA